MGNTDDADKYISLLEMTLNECRIDFQKRLPELSVILEYRFVIAIIVESPLEMFWFQPIAQSCLYTWKKQMGPLFSLSLR